MNCLHGIIKAKKAPHCHRQMHWANTPEHYIAFYTFKIMMIFETKNFLKPLIQIQRIFIIISTRVFLHDTNIEKYKWNKCCLSYWIMSFVCIMFDLGVNEFSRSIREKTLELVFGEILASLSSMNNLWEQTPCSYLIHVLPNATLAQIVG